MNIVLPIMTIVLLMVASKSQATVDCNERFNFRSLSNCCRLPDANLQEFGECYKFGTHPSQFACISSCIFNSTNAIENDRLNINNLRSRIVRLFKGDTTYLDETIIPAFKECDEEIQKEKMIKTNNFNTKAFNTPFESTCSILAQAYLMCASKKIFIKCPSNAWTPTTECETGKEYLANCGLKFIGRGKSFRGLNSRGRRGIQLL